jgi:hypothetical protein
MSALVTALIFLAAFTFGVGVGRLTAPPNSPASQGGAAYVGLSELGATEGQWRVQHRPDPRDPNARFLPRNLDGLDGFINVTFESGRVSGFIMQFKSGALDEAAAKVITRGVLPADVRLVFDSRKYLGSTDIDEQCDLLQYQSATIGALFAQHRQGVVSVVLWSPSPQGLLSMYDPASITSINVLATGTLGEIPDEC